MTSQAAALSLRRIAPRRRSDSSAFRLQDLLEAAGVANGVAHYRRGEVIFTQGDRCDHVLYIQSGGVELSVLSKRGRDAIVATLGPGDFFGEGCLAGQPVRAGSAAAVTPSNILRVGKQKMAALLHKQRAMAERFIAHVLSRNIQIEADLIDQLFNSSEKRLARALLTLARYGQQGMPARIVPRIPQDTLAEMIGSTRSRVEVSLKKFRKLGFIDDDGKRPLKVNRSLLSVVLHD